MSASPPNAVSVVEAAAELGISDRQLEDDIRYGAPVARRGRRGRGCRTLVIVADVRAWREARGNQHDAFARAAFAGEVSEIVAEAVYATFVAIAGPHKRASAGVLAQAWLRTSCALRERLDVPSPEPACRPEKITALLRIFEDL